MTSKLIALFTLALLLTTSIVFARAAPMQTYNDIAISGNDGKALQMEQIKKAIQAVATKREWITKSDGEGKLIATLDVRGKHSVVIAITYSTTQYSMTYKDSTNLNYKAKEGSATEIHPGYNKWLDTLKKEISLELQKPQ